jgi:tetratricopeptide (TPR) repeat protein
MTQSTSYPRWSVLRVLFDPEDAPFVAACEKLLDLAGTRGAEMTPQEVNEELVVILDELLPLRRAHVPADDPIAILVARQLNDLSDVLDDRGARGEVMERVLEEAIAILERWETRVPFHLGVTYSFLGEEMMRRGEFAEAERLYRETTRLWRRATEHPGWWAYLGQSFLAASLVAQGRMAEAEPLILEAHARLLDELGLGNAYVNAAMETMLKLYYESGRETQCVRVAREELRRRIDRGLEISTAHALNNVAWPVVRARGLEPEAYAEALMIVEEVHRRKPDHAGYLNTYGVAQYRAGRVADAAATLTRADRINTESMGGAPPDLAFLAMAHHRLGQPEQATAAMTRLRELMAKPEHADVRENRAFLEEAEAILAVERP